MEISQNFVAFSEYMNFCIVWPKHLNSFKKTKMYKNTTEPIFFKSCFYVRSVYSWTFYLITKIQNVFSFWPFKKTNQKTQIVLKAVPRTINVRFLFWENEPKEDTFLILETFMHIMYDFYQEAKQIRMQGALETGCSNFYSNIKEFTILVIVKWKKWISNL